MNTIDYYNASKMYLKKYEESLILLSDVIKQLTEAEINHDSIVSFVTKELDDGVVSKTALKETVKGDSGVLQVKGELLRLEAKKEVIKAKLGFFEMSYQLEKKMIDVNIQENKLLGGN